MHTEVFKIKNLFSNILAVDCFEFEVDALQKNVTAYKGGEILGRIIPQSVEQLIAVVKVAALHEIPLYPFSAGRNWGLGSKLPVEGAALLVDLGELQKIEVDVTTGIAVIQAGVTQEDLSRYLQENAPAYKFPMTGSGMRTSVVGNMLERGASAFFHRRKRLLGLELINGGGELLQTGHWRFAKGDPHAAFYAPGLGPDLTGLFVQANLGIVTAMAVQLLPKDTGTLIFSECNESEVTALINTVKELKAQDLLGEGLLITNKNDPRTAENKAFDYQGRWSLIACLTGVEAVRKVKQPLVAQVLNKHCDAIQFVDSNSNNALPHPYQEVLRDLYNGIPSDYSIQTMAQLHGLSLQSDQEVDHNLSFPGMAVALMAVPIQGEQTMQVVDLIRRISEKLDVHPYYNFASLDDSTFEGFFRVYFDRRGAQAIEQAHRWNKEVHALLEEELGIYPYRLNIQQMKDFTNRPANPFWNTVKELKSVLDPKNILARGRYCPK